jgi:membrane protein YqaA with SNARE-associated domain
VTDDPDQTRGRVALILAAGAAAGILLLTAAALIDAMLDPDSRGISPAYASIITTTLGVVVGGLVGYIGGTVTSSNPPDPPLDLDPGPVEDPDTPNDPPGR